MAKVDMLGKGEKAPSFLGVPLQPSPREALSCEPCGERGRSVQQTPGGLLNTTGCGEVTWRPVYFVPTECPCASFPDVGCNEFLHLPKSLGSVRTRGDATTCFVERVQRNS